MGNFFSNFVTDFISRFDGPLHFRLFVQPSMAILFAVRDGTRDAREGRSAYLWSLLSDPDERRYLLESGWKGIAKVFVLAFVLDVVYQFMEWHGLKPAAGPVDGSGGRSVLTAARPSHPTPAYQPDSNFARMKKESRS